MHHALLSSTYFFLQAEFHYLINLFHQRSIVFNYLQPLLRSIIFNYLSRSIIFNYLQPAPSG